MEFGFKQLVDCSGQYVVDNPLVELCSVENKEKSIYLTLY